MDAVFFERIQRLRCFLWVGSELIRGWDSQLIPGRNGIQGISPYLRKYDGRSSNPPAEILASP